MKRSPTSPSPRRAFTLIELLVAIAVLALMTIFLAQMLSSASQTWLLGKGRVDNFSKARALLDLLAGDLQSGIYRGDLSAFPSTNVAFYTRRAGFVGGANPVRDISLVQYTLWTNTVLQRADMGITWSDPATSISFGNTNTLPNLVSVTGRDTSEGVVGFRILFLGTNGNLSSNYVRTNGLKGFAVGLAVVDGATLKKMSPTQIGDLQGALQGRVSGTNSIKADWDSYLNSGMNWGAYPKSLGGGFKVFERYVYLP